MEAVDRVVRAVDRLQRRNVALGLAIAVQRKFADDHGASLAANLAYSGFVAVFPLLLLLVTVLGIVAGGHPAFARSVERSVLAQFPIIGSDLEHNVRELHRATVPGLVFGLLGLLWGATGLSQTGLFAMAQVWDVPVRQRPGFWQRAGRSLSFLAILGTGVAATGFLSGFGLLGRHGPLVGAVSDIGSAAVTVAFYLAGLRVLTVASVPARRLCPGAVAGGIAWTVLEGLGGELVSRTLRHESALYGLFAIVLGLLAWIYLGARVAMYSAELNAVLALRIWPRSLAAPITDADRRALVLLAASGERRPGEHVSVTFADHDRPEDRDGGP